MADIAAVWPASAQVAPVPIPDMEPGDAITLRSSPAPDAHASAHRLAIAALVALLAAFAAGVLTGIL